MKREGRIEDNRRKKSVGNEKKERREEENHKGGGRQGLEMKTEDKVFLKKSMRGERRSWWR